MRELINLFESPQETELDEAPLIILGKNGAKPRQDAFMADYLAATHEHPLDRSARLSSNASMTVGPFDGGLRISDILSLSPGQGGGKEALKLICALADKHDLKITLTAKNYGHGDRLSTAQLRDWYLRYGFVDDRDDPEDYSGDDEEGWDMIRYPG